MSQPLPRKLLEHGGSENPVTEGQLQSQLKQDQAEWYRTQAEAECPYLLRARDLLIKAGFRSDAIELKFGHEEDIARNISRKPGVEDTARSCLGVTGRPA